MSAPRREIYVADAVTWLRANPLPDVSCVASIPDYSEFPGRTLAAWREWFEDAAEAALRATAPTGVTIFYQTDIKVEGTWVDKGFLCQRAAERVGAALLWHKVACRARPGQATFGRPGYGHILCFSRELRPAISVSTADVVPELGDKAWERGMGFAVCRMIATFIKEQTSTKLILNPFCGLGSMIAVANVLGLDAIGIERSPKRAARAQALQVDSTAGRFSFPDRL